VSDANPTEAAILRLTGAVGPGKSIDPTEIARDLAPGPGDAWRQYLSAIRRAAIRLAEAGQIDILRKGKPVPHEQVRGVIRLRARPPEKA